jgi:citrate lyase beta subunit
MTAPLSLAPLLYVPASRPGLQDILGGKKNLGICSLAVCLEDAVRPNDRSRAATDLCEVLHRIDSAPPRALLVRPADSDMLSRLLNTAHLDHITAFLLPKATAASIYHWIKILDGRFPLVPILESRETLDAGGRRELAAVCAEHRESILRVRVGANDLFAQLGGLRRPRGFTVYETPLGRIIDELIEVFCAHDLPLCGPVFDRLDDLETLRREVEQDIHRGIFCKTALNPTQVAAIWAAYRPSEEELDEARLILHPDSPAVFSLNGSMQETACHAEWARRLVMRDVLHREAEELLGSPVIQALPSSGSDEACYPVHKASAVA